ncbi:MAG: FAD:protein FMN transferase [Phycisphaerales bacterium]|nr:FAD:protein FMN transferase [Phycisphaerales bacterium]
MTRKRTAAAVPWLAAWTALAAACTPVHEYRRIVMGAECRVVVAADEQTADRAAEAAFARLAEVEQALSDWMAGSEVRRLPVRAGEQSAVSADLAAAIAASLAWSERTDGAFDATLGALTGAWRAARRAGTPLDPAEARALVARCGWRHVRFDPAARTFSSAVDGLRFDFGAIGQGLGADAAMAAIRAQGVQSALVDLSGDIVAGEAPPGRRAWRVAADDDQATTLFLRNQAVTTSGDRAQHLDAGGVRLSHVLDPATGWPVTTRVQVTAGAPTATDADALATALCVLGPERGRALLARLGPGYWATWSWPDGAAATPAPARTAPESPRIP